METNRSAEDQLQDLIEHNKKMIMRYEQEIADASTTQDYVLQGAASVKLDADDRRHCLDTTLPGLPCIMNDDAQKGILQSLLVSNDEDDASTTCSDTDPDDVLTEEEDSHSDPEPPLPENWKHPQDQWYDRLLDLCKDTQP